jgi:hypothetical protein
MDFAACASFAQQKIQTPIASIVQPKMNSRIAFPSTII